MKVRWTLARRTAALILAILLPCLGVSAAFVLVSVRGEAETVVRVAALFLVLSMWAVLGTILITRRLSKPILALSRASAELAAGGVPAPVAVGGDDEVTQLTRTFNAMVKAVGSAATYNARLIRSQKDTLARLMALQSVTDAALSTLELDSLLQSLLERSMEIVSADGGAILLLDEKAGELAISAYSGIPPEIAVGYRRKLGEGISGRAAAERRPVMITDIDAEPELPAQLSRARGVRSVLAAPLVGRARTLGVLRLDGRESGRFTDEHLQLMAVVAERMALAIENAELLKEAKERAAHLELVHRIASAIGASLDLDTVVNTAVRELGVATGASRCLVLLGRLEDYQAGRRWEYCAEGVPSVMDLPLPPYGIYFLQRVMLSAEPQAVVDLDAHLESRGALGGFPERQVRSVLSARIVHAREPIGLLTLQQCDRVRSWTTREIGLIEAVATQLTVALENARLYGETDQMLQARLRELRGLLGLGRALSERLSTDTVVERAAVEGCKALAAALCSVLTFDPESRLLAVRGAYQEDSGKSPTTNWQADPSRLPFFLRRLEQRDPAVVRLEDPGLTHAEVALLQRFRLGAALVAPLVVGDQAIGIMLFGRRVGARGFSGEEQSLAAAIAGQVAVALENARLFQEVSLQRNRTEALLASMNEGMFATDLEGRVTTMNHWLLAALGRQSREVLGHPWSAVLEPVDQEGDPVPEADSPVAAVLARGTATEPRTIFLRTGRGDRLATSISAAPIRDEGGRVVGSVSVVRDITREWEVDKLKSGIISVVSHEFRTPLTSIIGFSELLLTGERTEEERRECLEHVHREGLRLESLVNDFLDVSRLESGRVVLHPEPLDVAEEVARGLESLGPEAHGRQVVIQLEKDLPPLVADPSRMEQILTNLLSNAFKYSSKGSVVTVAARRAAPGEIGGSNGQRVCEGEWLVLTVEDQGIGIATDQIELLFTPFHRVDDARTRGIRGTGLGLSIVKYLVELHGGRIWVDSVVGHGSRFHVALPTSDE